MLPLALSTGRRSEAPRARNVLARVEEQLEASEVVE